MASRRARPQRSLRRRSTTCSAIGARRRPARGAARSNLRVVPARQGRRRRARPAARYRVVIGIPRWRPASLSRADGQALLYPGTDAALRYASRGYGAPPPGQPLPARRPSLGERLAGPGPTREKLQGRAPASSSCPTRPSCWRRAARPPSRCAGHAEHPAARWAAGRVSTPATSRSRTAGAGDSFDASHLAEQTTRRGRCAWPAGETAVCRPDLDGGRWRCAHCRPSSVLGLRCNARLAALWRSRQASLDGSAVAGGGREAVSPPSTARRCAGRATYRRRAGPPAGVMAYGPGRRADITVWSGGASRDPTAVGAGARDLEDRQPAARWPRGHLPMRRPPAAACYSPMIATRSPPVVPADSTGRATAAFSQR